MQFFSRILLRKAQGGFSFTKQCFSNCILVVHCIYVFLVIFTRLDICLFILNIYVAHKERLDSILANETLSKGKSQLTTILIAFIFLTKIKTLWQ